MGAGELRADRVVGGVRMSPMTAAERSQLGDWAVQEGWNPGRGDLPAVAALEPEAFVAVREQGELIAGGTIFRPSHSFGFMGLFIVRPDRRGEGLGRSLWNARRNLLLGRLTPPATTGATAIGMDGVFDLVPFYERGGFVLAHRDLRFEGVADGVVDPEVLDLADPARADCFEGLVELDASAFGDRRAGFLSAWLMVPGVRTAALLCDGRVSGFGVLRPATVGFKLGPVVATSPAVASRLVVHRMASIIGEQVQFDVPEANGAAVALAGSLGLVPSFGCARMYLGRAPETAIDRLFGVASFEFG